MDWTVGLALAGLMMTQFSLLWHRLGKVEQKIQDHCKEIHPMKEA